LHLYGNNGYAKTPQCNTRTTSSIVFTFIYGTFILHTLKCNFLGGFHETPECSTELNSCLFYRCPPRLDNGSKKFGQLLIYIRKWNMAISKAQPTRCNVFSIYLFL